MSNNKNIRKCIASVLAVTSILSAMTATAFASSSSIAVMSESEGSEDMYQITMNSTISGSTDSPQTTKSSAKAGATVTVNLGNQEGFEVESVTVTDAGGNNISINDNYEFVMPASNVIVNVVFNSTGSSNPSAPTPTPVSSTVSIKGSNIPEDAKLSAKRTDVNSSSFEINAYLADAEGNALSEDPVNVEVTIALTGEYANASKLYVYTKDSQVRALATWRYTEVSETKIEDNKIIFNSSLPNIFVISTEELTETGEFVNAEAIANAKTELSNYIQSLNVDTSKLDDEAIKTAYNEALKAAQDIVNNDSATLTEVNKASDDLKTAVSAIPDSTNPSTGDGDDNNNPSTGDDNNPSTGNEEDDNKPSTGDGEDENKPSTGDEDDNKPSTGDEDDNKPSTGDADDKVVTVTGGVITATGKFPNGSTLQVSKTEQPDSTSFEVSASVVDAAGNELITAANPIEVTVSIKLEGDFATATKLYVYVVNKITRMAEYTEVANTISDGAISFNSTLPNDFVISTVELNHSGDIATADDIANAKTELDNYIKSLTIDSSKLNNADLKTEYETALNAAIAVIANESATLSDVNLASNNLNKAVEKVNNYEDPAVKEAKTKLKNLIDGTKVDPAKHTTVSYKIYKDALDDANAILNKKDATVNEINKAYADFSAAVVSAEATATTALKADLQKLIDDNKIETSKITKDYSNALNTAKNVIANKNATLDETYNAFNNLKKAIDTIKNSASNINRETLQKLINDNKIEQSQCTAALYNTYTKALDAAKKVIADETATADAVKTAYDNLNKAIVDINSYRVSEAQKELKSIISKLKIDEKLYTADSYKTYSTALAKATLAVDDKNAKYEDIKAATDALNTAVEGLVKLYNSPTTKPDQNTQQPNTNGSQNNKPTTQAPTVGATTGKPSNNNPYTGAASTAGMFACVSSLAAVVVGKYRKRK